MKVKIVKQKTLIDNMIDTPDNDLNIINNLINWEAVYNQLNIIKTDYNTITLFKILLLQAWYNLSDKEISNSIKRDLVFMDFCNLSIETNKPDGSTICRFRNKLHKLNLFEKVLETINKDLENKGLKISNGKYVSADATLITSCRRPKKKLETLEATEVKTDDNSEENNAYIVDEISYSDDTDAAWTKKANKAIYGFSTVVLTDSNGFVEYATTNPANTNENKFFSEFIKKTPIKKGQKILYDKGACSKKNDKALKDNGYLNGIMKKATKNKPLSERDKLRNKLISGMRFVVERTFGTIKASYGMHRSSYLGANKTNGQFILKSICYNLTRAKNVFFRKVASIF